VDLGLGGKVVLVTGVSQGIGLACAHSFLAEGAVVVGTSRSAPPATEGLTHLQLDMTDPDAPERAVAETVELVGSLDVLVNNVGTGKIWTGFADEPETEWRELFELNLMAAIRTTRAALPHLVDGGGVVVNVSSINGHLPHTSIYSYSAFKAGLDSVTVALSNEFAPQGVRVVGVAPGPVETRMWLGSWGVAAVVGERTGKEPQTVVEETSAGIPVRRFTTAKEVGDLVAFLASARAGTISGTTVRIDGGLTPGI
jgi:NAD(P)-dependent dehydrogenase (short-subunit alcohol dehydrogenase family)